MAKSQLIVKKYSNVYVSKLRPNSINTEKVLSKKLSKPLTSKQIVSMVSEELGATFHYDGRLGTYLIYKASAKQIPYYYVLSIS